MTSTLAKLRFTRWQLFVHLAALMPLAALLWDAWQGNLSVNPIQDVTLRTGKPAMVLLVATLAATPLHRLFRFRQGLRARRALGLYAFFYATLHFLTYLWLDYDFDLHLISLELAEKRYVLVGFAAFLILLPLAVTSTKGWQRRLQKNWKRLHRSVYLAAILVMLHYIWVQKADVRQPLIWTGALALLLLLRWRPGRRRSSRRLHPMPLENESLS